MSQESSPPPERTMRTMQMLTRAALASILGSQFGGDRQLYTVLGYDRVIKFQSYYNAYKRGGIAKRIVEAAPIDTWRHNAEIYEDSDSGTPSAFDAAIKSLQRRLKMFERLSRLDRISGIGEFGILVIGIRGQKLDAPLKPGSVKDVKDVIYLEPYHQGSVTIQTYETRTENPRFGRPLIYKVAIQNPGSPGAPQNIPVHWTRVIHVAEDPIERDWIGTPRLESSYNRLMDIEKTIGGSAEMFWLGAYRGPVFSTKEGFVTTDDSDPNVVSAKKTKFENYSHGLQRALDVEGFDVEWPPVQSPDPGPVIDAIVADLSSGTGIPKRKLMGSERGELSSAQDEENWIGRVEARRRKFAEPLIIRALIDRLQQAGAIPDAVYCVDWPSLFELNEKDRSDIAKNKAQAIAAYAPPGMAETVVPEAEFREVILGLDAFPDAKYLAAGPEPPPEVDIEEDDPSQTGLDGLANAT